MDFTLTTYKSLLETLLSKYSQYSFLSFKEYMENNISDKKPVIILRHDVDRLPQNALKIAELEHSMGIKATYYFRVVGDSYNLSIMNKISDYGHEIGYHYEDVHLINKHHKVKMRIISEEELIDLAYESFCKNIELFRKDFEISTICMHGSPLSKFDNKIIWKKYSYKLLEILGEPYIDINWNECGYLTDTGRRWNGDNVSVRDKVNSRYKLNFRSTHNVIENIKALPEQLMVTIHPERWTNSPASWATQLITQNIKNIVKLFIANNYT